MGREIQERWAADPHHNYNPEPRRYKYMLTNVGDQGYWRRPDLTLVGGMTLPFLPGKFLDVVTFEVKLWSNQSQRLSALYEAVAHRRRATHSYVLYFLPYGDQMKEEDSAAIMREAIRTGVGVYVARQEDDIETWSELVEPVRHAPDPRALHDFVLTLTNRDAKFRLSLRRWIRADPFGGSLTREQIEGLPCGDISAEDIADFYDEIPPALDTEGYGFSKARPRVETVAKLLKISNDRARTIKQRLLQQGLITVSQGGGMERRQ